jgi:hypothetical protein
MQLIFVLLVPILMVGFLAGCERLVGWDSKMRVMSDWETHDESERCKKMDMEVVVVESWRGVHDVFCEPKAKSVITIPQP